MRNLFDLKNFKNENFFIFTFLNILRIKNILLKTLNNKKMNTVNGNNTQEQTVDEGVYFLLFFREYMFLLILIQLQL